MSRDAKAGRAPPAEISCPPSLKGPPAHLLKDVRVSGEFDSRDAGKRRDPVPQAMLDPLPRSLTACAL
jgi:hypothetical protein